MICFLPTDLSKGLQYISYSIMVAQIIYQWLFGLDVGTSAKSRWSHLQSPFTEWRSSIHQWCHSSNIHRYRYLCGSTNVILGQYTWIWNNNFTLSIDCVNHSISFSLNNFEHYSICQTFVWLYTFEYIFFQFFLFYDVLFYSWP